MPAHTGNPKRYGLGNCEPLGSIWVEEIAGMARLFSRANDYRETGDLREELSDKLLS